MLLKFMVKLMDNHVISLSDELPTKEMVRQWFIDNIIIIIMKIILLRTSCYKIIIIVITLIKTEAFKNGPNGFKSGALRTGSVFSVDR